MTNQPTRVPNDATVVVSFGGQRVARMRGHAFNTLFIDDAVLAQEAIQSAVGQAMDRAMEVYSRTDEEPTGLLANLQREGKGASDF